MDNEQKISIVVTYLPVPHEDVIHLTTECFQRIKKNTFYPFELIRVNNGPTLHGENEDVVITNKENLGNAKAWDQGVGVASNNVVVLMDNDVWVEKNWDKEMVDRLSEYEVGITFPYSVVGQIPDDQKKEYRGRRDGFCFAFTKDTYNTAGPFLCDQPFKLGYYEDDWFEYRVQHDLGLKLVACPTSKVWHCGQGTTKKVWSKEIDEGIKANQKWYESKTHKVYPYLSKD